MQFPVINGSAQYKQYMAMSHIAIKMTQTGWRVNKERAAEHRDSAEVRAKALKAEVQELTGLDPGPSGLGPKWKEYFLKTLGLPPVSFAKHTREPQLNAAALMTYANDWEDPEVRKKARALWLYRKNTKLLNAFLYPLLAMEGDRTHPSFNITGTKGARWSASDPNIQQVSKDVTETVNGVKTVLVPSFKDVFIADEGCVILKADYDQLELRLITYVAGVTKIMEWIKSGADTHLENAIGLFGLKRLATTKEMKEKYKGFRDAAKPCAYGLSYNRSENVEQLWKQLKTIPQFKAITIPQVQKLRKIFFRLQPEILGWQDRTQEQIDAHGWIEAPVMLRRLYLQRNMRGYNQANNFQMQTTGGDLINRALVGLYEELRWAEGEQIRAQVHDELVLQTREEWAQATGEKITRHMSAPLKFGVHEAQFPAEVSIGYSWGRTKPLSQWT